MTGPTDTLGILSNLLQKLTAMMNRFLANSTCTNRRAGLKDVVSVVNDYAPTANSPTQHVR